MPEKITLRNTPELKFSLDTDEFNIVDVSEPKNSGTYSYSEIKDVELNKEQSNWIYSISTYLAEFFLSFLGVDLAAGGNYKDKANLTIKLSNRNLKIWLINAKFTEAQKLTKLINGKRNLHTTRGYK
jgi:hypothetical protein